MEKNPEKPEKDVKTTKAEEESDEDDIEQCPILKDRLSSLTPEQIKEMKTKYDQIVKPMIKKRKEEKGAEEEKKEGKPAPEERKPKVRKQHPRFEKYKNAQGSCPYMNTSTRPSLNPPRRVD